MTSGRDIVLGLSGVKGLLISSGDRGDSDQSELSRATNRVDVQKENPSLRTPTYGEILNFRIYMQVDQDNTLAIAELIHRE